MAHRVGFFCQKCQVRGKPIEVFDIQFWVDEDDQILFFIANCESCKASQIFKTSIEELCAKVRISAEEQGHIEPKYQM